MQISGISLIILLIPISTANKSPTVKCEGDQIKLSCLESNSLTKAGVYALWKKSSGERVIWKNQGDSKKGGSFTNRTINLNDDFSLSIEDCSLSDQGRYILCINGKPSCNVMLFVKASKNCNKQKSATDATDDLQTKSSLPENYIKWGACVAVGLLVVSLLAACVYIQRTKSKNKPEFKQLNTDTQINKV